MLGWQGWPDGAAGPATSAPTVTNLLSLGRCALEPPRERSDPPFSSADTRGGRPPMPLSAWPPLAAAGRAPPAAADGLPLGAALVKVAWRAWRSGGACTSMAGPLSLAPAVRASSTCRRCCAAARALGPGCGTPAVGSAVGAAGTGPLPLVGAAGGGPAGAEAQRTELSTVAAAIAWAANGFMRVRSMQCRPASPLNSVSPTTLPSR